MNKIGSNDGDDNNNYIEFCIYLFAYWINLRPIRDKQEININKK
jgi:hypothetical protein